MKSKLGKKESDDLTEVNNELMDWKPNMFEKKKFRLANKNKLVGKTKNARQWRWGAVEIKTLEEAQLSVITRSGIWAWEDIARVEERNEMHVKRFRHSLGCQEVHFV